MIPGPRTLAGGACLALLCLAPLAAAGTADAPEVQDPVGDQALLGIVPLGDRGPSTTDDVRAAWVDGETPDAVAVNLRVAGSAAPTAAGIHRYAVHLLVGGQPFEATLLVQPSPPAGDGSVTAGGVASGVTAAGSVFRLAIPKAAIGHPAAGARASGLWALSEGSLRDDPVAPVLDRAPDAGTGSDYVFTAGSAETAPAQPVPPPSTAHRGQALAAGALVSSSATLASLAVRARRAA